MLTYERDIFVEAAPAYYFQTYCLKCLLLRSNYPLTNILMLLPLNAWQLSFDKTVLLSWKENNYPFRLIQFLGVLFPVQCRSLAYFTRI